MSFLLSRLTDGFDLLFRSTLQASVLILIILGLRLLIGRRLQGRWLYALWLIVLIRLALPWTPASRLSLYGILPDLHPARTHTLADVAQTPTGLAPSASFDPNMASASLRSPAATRGPEASRAAVVPVTDSPQAAWSIKRVVALIWLGGMLALATSFLAANFTFLLAIRREPLVIDEQTLRLLEDCKARMGVRTVLGLVASDRVKSPALCGFIRPRLLLPPELIRTLDPTELRHVFLHELAHLKRHDIVVGWLMSLLQIVHWLNPLVWLALYRMRLDRELACDALALSALAPDTPRDYGRTILHVFECFRGRQYMPALAGIMDNPSQLQRRIAMIARPHPATRGSALLGISLLLGLALITLTDSSRAAGADADKDDKAKPAVAARAPDADGGEKVTLPEGSKIDEHGRIIDKIDWPFVDDPPAIGKWESVDFVKKIEEFDPKKPKTKPEDLFLRGVVLSKGGQASFAWKGWTKGLLMHEGDKTASKYVIKDIDGATYMFLEWKSGDYTIRHCKPLLYVLKKLPANSSKFEKPTELFAPNLAGPKAELGPDSKIDERGRIVDKIDYPFVDDSQVIGQWKSVDFVDEMKEFDPGKPHWKGDLFLKEMLFLPKGRLSPPWATWTKGLVLQPGDHTASKYIIKEMNGSTYMFFEWKSGDYIIMHRKPSYYVLKKISSDPGEAGRAWSKLPSDEEFARYLQEKVAKLNIASATIEDVIKVFGEPGEYIWGEQRFTRDKLPDRYIMLYPAGFRVAMYNGHIGELRFERPGLGYSFEGKLKVGSSVDDVLKVLGEPTKTVKGEKCTFESGVLYQDMSGRPGWGYYARADRNVRMFFMDGKVIALYVTRPGMKP